MRNRNNGKFGCGYEEGSMYYKGKALDVSVSCDEASAEKTAHKMTQKPNQARLSSQRLQRKGRLSKGQSRVNKLKKAKKVKS